MYIKMLSRKTFLLKTAYGQSFESNSVMFSALETAERKKVNDVSLLG